MATPSHHNPTPIELLAPARNAEIARAAIIHGADAVYIGAESFGARAAATNSIDDIKALCDFAAQYQARIYVTVNTILYDHELKAAEAMIKRLYRAGVDALIVQDMGLLRIDLPPIALHASTQCDIRTPQRARFLQDAGFSQLVLPRELSLTEIQEIREAVDVPLESFVHGALCVSYSGDCHAGWVLKGRSANRGECPQICRLPFDLYDGDGNLIARERHLLSLKDMNRASGIESMMEAGISSFKIEGRLKDAGYVKNICAFYRKRIDDIIEHHPDRYVRSSFGTTETGFNPAAEKSFNRGFTPYFLDGKPGKIASIYTPKSQGEPVGKVKRSDGNCIIADLKTPLANGDGMGFFDSDNRFTGFRLNRIEGNRLYPATRIYAAPGTTLYRNSDKAFDDLLSRRSSSRSIAVKMTLRLAGDRLALDVADERGNSCSTLSDPIKIEPAKTPQTDARRRIMGKLGETIYRLDSYEDLAGEIFIPAKELASLRRKALELLESDNRCRLRRELRRPEKLDAVFPDGTEITYHENVANRLARQFYLDHGVTRIQPAAEIASPGKNPQVMTTRYCLRRELGACLKEGGNDKLRGPLTLRSGNIALALEFDCKSCRMKVNALDNCQRR
ncbi:MAG: U32 family peptidase [Bacteroides sp.]|nr:U32 family peptidase [Bacteroides sp.]